MGCLVMEPCFNVSIILILYVSVPLFVWKSLVWPSHICECDSLIFVNVPLSSSEFDTLIYMNVTLSPR